jgi:hypothetical protein
VPPKTVVVAPQPPQEEAPEQLRLACPLPEVSLEVEEPLSKPNATDKKIVPLDENCDSIPELVIETESP